MIIQKWGVFLEESLLIKVKRLSILSCLTILINIVLPILPDLKMFGPKNYCTIMLLLKKCPCSESLWSAFSRLRTEYGEIKCMWENTERYKVWMRENTDQNNSEYGHYLHSVLYLAFPRFCKGINQKEHLPKYKFFFKKLCELVTYIFCSYYNLLEK